MKHDYFQLRIVYRLTMAVYCVYCGSFKGSSVVRDIYNSELERYFPSLYNQNRLKEVFRQNDILQYIIQDGYNHLNSKRSWL